MNIKNLAIRNNCSTNEPKVAYIEFEGEGVVTAADIQVDSDIQILNPDLVIANLNGGADCKLYMELTITKGRGYVSAEKNKTEDTPIGVIAVDSIYTPVTASSGSKEPFGYTSLYPVDRSVLFHFSLDLSDSSLRKLPVVHFHLTDISRCGMSHGMCCRSHCPALPALPFLQKSFGGVLPPDRNSD